MTDPDLPHEGERLQKVLARAGIASRRRAEDFIADGRVRVNGEVAILGRRVVVERDRIELDGIRVQTNDALVHYLLYKPERVVSTSSDPEGRKTVVELVPEEPRVFSVGRLDYDTEGLIILTNDGDLSNRLMHPSHGVEKEYIAEVVGNPNQAALRLLRDGVELDDGITAPARVRLVDSTEETSMLSIVLKEGRKRQVRRMCESVGHPVVRLVRVRIGPISDRSLQPGRWRLLTTNEVRALEAATIGVDPARFRGELTGASDQPSRSRPYGAGARGETSRMPRGSDR